MSVENQILPALNQALLQKLQALDLEPIKQQLIQSGWTHQQTNWAILRYKMFLSVVYLHPHTPLVPTQEIDFVWHCHILHTRKYRQDCQMLFGRFIDHEPGLKLWGISDQLSLDTAFAQTTTLLVEYFGEKPYSHFQRSACGRPALPDNHHCSLERGLAERKLMCRHILEQILQERWANPLL
jgi:uncharacterized protein DUF1399